MRVVDVKVRILIESDTDDKTVAERVLDALRMELSIPESELVSAEVML